MSHSHNAMFISQVLPFIVVILFLLIIIIFSIKQITNKPQIKAKVSAQNQNSNCKKSKMNMQLTDFSTETSVPSTSISKTSAGYKKSILPNGKTIGEQQVIDLNISMGNYPHKTPEFLGMKIISSTVPPQDNYSILNENEKNFFRSLHEHLIQAKLNPAKIQLCRLSSGGFNVEYIGVCHIGKINLYEHPKKYAVIKSGNQRASKIFDNFNEATEYTSHNLSDMCIEVRQEKTTTYMQYFKGLNSTKEFSDISIDQCISLIPYWIRYINYCIHN